MKLILSTIAILFVSLCISSCSFPKHKVRYEVKCTKCLVSYIKEKDEYVERVTASGTWSYEFLAYQGQRLTLAGANEDTLTDNVALSIYLNGNLVDSLSKKDKKWSAASINYIVQ